VTTVVRKVLRALMLAAAVLSAPSAGWAGDGPVAPEKDTPAARARRQTEIRIVVAGCALLGVGLVKWGRDLAVVLRKRRAARRAPARPWQESGETNAPHAGTGWTYHPPPNKADAQPAAEGGREDADATVRIRRPRKP
jgi:hypothetical protein